MAILKRRDGTVIAEDPDKTIKQLVEENCRNFRCANFRDVDLRDVDLQGADLRDADLRFTDLRGADLQSADLQGADLQGADLDFSCWPLCCGSKNIKVSIKIVYQLLAHIAVVDCNEPEFAEIKKFITPYARKSHRATDLGLF